MGQAESRQEVVVTLYLGDAANAYAFKFLQKAGRTQMNPNWGSEVSCPYWLSPSCVLYHADGSLAEEFGVKAELEYFRQLEHGGEGGKPALYRQFKKQYQGKVGDPFSFNYSILHLKRHTLRHNDYHKLGNYKLV